MLKFLFSLFRPRRRVKVGRPMLCSVHPMFWGKMYQMDGEPYVDQYPVSYGICPKCSQRWKEEAGRD